MKPKKIYYKKVIPLTTRQDQLIMIDRKKIQISTNVIMNKVKRIIKYFSKRHTTNNILFTVNQQKVIHS